MRPAYIRGSMVCAALLAGCFAAPAGQLADDPEAQWIPGLPIANSFAGIVEFDSDPPGAEVTTSLGGTCYTPCSLEITAEGSFTATFTREGFMATTAQVKIQHARMGVSERKFAPNPVIARLLPEAKPEPPPPPKQQAARPRPAPKKPIARAQPTHAPREKPAAAVTPTVPPPEKPAAAMTPTVPPPEKPAAAPQPPQVPPGTPAVATQPPQAAPAQSAWPTEVKPIPGINSGRIVPTAPPASGDNAVARRWLENPDKPAKDQ